HCDYLAAKGIDLAGLERRPGPSLFWHGRYHEDVNVRDTLVFEPGVFAGFEPRLRDEARTAPYVFLGVIDPAIQARVLDQLAAPVLVGLDTIEHYIVHTREPLLRLRARSVLVKRGEYGAILFSPGSVFAVPAFPLEQVFDPTGAGDTFAGGLMG